MHIVWYYGICPPATPFTTALPSRLRTASTVCIHLLLLLLIQPLPADHYLYDSPVSWKVHKVPAVIDHKVVYAARLACSTAQHSTTHGRASTRRLLGLPATTVVCIMIFGKRLCSSAGVSTRSYAKVATCPWPPTHTPRPPPLAASGMNKGSCTAQAERTARPSCLCEWHSMRLHTPGCLDTMAKLLRFVSKFMSDDLPTLDRPMTANSGYFGCGQSLTATLLLTNSAVFIWEFVGGGSCRRISGNSCSSMLLLMVSVLLLIVSVLLAGTTSSSEMLSVSCCAPLTAAGVM